MSTAGAVMEGAPARRLSTPSGASPRSIRRSCCGNGKGRSSTPSTTEKIAVVAPMPKASVSTAVIVKPADLRNCRKTKRRSCKTFRRGIFLRLHFFSELPEFVFGYHLAVEQMHFALRVLGKARIVRHHANRRSFAMQIG